VARDGHLATPSHHSYAAPTSLTQRTIQDRFHPETERPVTKLEANEALSAVPPPGNSPALTDAISKLRLPRKLLEKWVEEPFFEQVVIGCFVRLGVGKAPGSRSLPQYRVCEIVGVVDYKYSYAFGEFQTKKALMLRIGHNQRVWRMNVISNHRFTPTELEEWHHTMKTEQQHVPSADEINKRKARMREAIFGLSNSLRATKDTQSISTVPRVDTIQQDESVTYSEADVARLVDARRKRSEAARFRERQSTFVARLNHGQIRTRYEHEVCAAREAYAALLLAHCKQLRITPELQVAMNKVEGKDALGALAESSLDALASSLANACGEQLDAGVAAELSADCHAARKLVGEALQRLNDFLTNAFDVRKKLDTEAPSRTSALYLINEAKKQENALADMAHGSKKLQDEHRDNEDAEHAIFQRRATKPMMLWTTCKEQGQMIHAAQMIEPRDPQKPIHSASIQRKGSMSDEQISPNQAVQSKARHRNGMSLQEYVIKSRTHTTKSKESVDHS